ncbi:nucleocapsid [Yongjia Tick Virus 2]|uniref:Nucleoprotein n=1 Tax=Yongjia Tick Virus 2 TaxID=1608146 RepID=A0A0B5KXT6_9RHAB|nr:nucleocapsid [Yongjia Tick Virus 2]AJG39228.1 nucleocapsid [Yongjia Tick Virus 2]
MATRGVFRLATGKRVITTLPQDETPGEFASDWFDKHPKQKPRLVIPHKTDDLKLLRQVVKRGLKEGNLSVQTATTYVYKVLSQVELDSEDVWTSFGVEIALAKQRVGPFCMMQVELREEPLANTETATATEDDDQWMVFYILAQYRILKLQNADYERLIINKANNHLSAMKGKADEKQDLDGSKRYGAWVQDPTYLKIVAAVDMFFCKFKDSPWAIVRFGTLGSRYRDATALTTLNHITQRTGLTIDQFMLWIFNDTVADELDRMSREGQELDKHDSYVPYIRDMGLSAKSPYSAQLNPAFHFFCHAIGALMNSTRSINAKLGPEVDLTNTLANAQVVAYALSSCPVMVKAYGTDPQDKPVEDQDTDLGGLPKEPNPSKWYDYLVINNFQLPREIIEYSKTRASVILNPRPGTVGEMISKTLR